MPSSPQEALALLKEGNQRFVSNRHRAGLSPQDARFTALEAGQHPFATVLGCSDSRVPVEVVFDTGPGELFVIRVAGNIAGATQIGSVEFATEGIGTRLVVVLGHSCCGAIRATLDALSSAEPGLSSHLMAIVDRIRPAVEPLLASDLARDREALVREAVRANVRTVIADLRRKSTTIDRLVRAGKILIVGAEYDLHSGRVEFMANSS